jgi:hypothetical protein
VKKQLDIRPARTASPLVTQCEVSDEIGWHIGALHEVENGNVGIDDETYDAIHAAVRRVKARKGSKCEKAEGLAVT